MEAFATLIDRLAFTSSTLAKRRLMADYFLHQGDPERGFALASLTGLLSFNEAKPAFIRELVLERVDPYLYRLSRDYVGDSAETIALMWPTHLPDTVVPSLEEVVHGLSTSDKAQLRQLIPHWLDVLNSTGRWALLKLIMGNIRIGVSSRLAKTALSDAFGRPLEDIEEIWHGLEPPYTEFFHWLEGKAERPELGQVASFFPLMLSHPIEAEELEKLPLKQYQFEWKWDGIRVEFVKAGEAIALYSRTGDDISRAFPELVALAQKIPEEEFALDGELLIMREGNLAPFNDLQQRLNRKTVTAKMLEQFPPHIRLYDILVDNSQDMRKLPLDQRRRHLEAWLARQTPYIMGKWLDISPIIPISTHEERINLRERARTHPKVSVEGLMIKRRASPYLSGRPRGHWFKWKRDTLRLDCVLMYAQRGSGKRSSFYSDYTFGVWHEGKLLPIGKSYSGFTDEELVQLDRWIRAHTRNKFGPVREVEIALVLEIEFDSIHPSPRHKSGLAMRFPRVHRIRWDKPALEADSLANARELVIS